MKKISDFFGKIVKWSNSHKTIFALIITALFVLVHVPVLVNHEIWDDEGTVWALSKEINPGNIYEVNSVEPHPLLWELILAPFSQAGLPFYTMNIISLILVALAVFLLIRFAPMNFFVKILFILSIGFFYYNPVVARDYSLIPLAICLVCMTYKKRHEKPFLYGLSLAFLSQTHFLMYGFLAALTFGFIIEETFEKKGVKKLIISIISCTLPIVLAVATTIPMVIGSFNEHAIITGRSYDVESVTTGLYENTIGNHFGYYAPIMEPIVTVFIVIMMVFLFSSSIRVGFYALAGGGFWVYVMQNIYPNYYIFAQKVSILSLICIGIVWILKLEDSQKKNILGKIISKTEIAKYLFMKFKSPAIPFIVLLVAFSIPRAISIWIKDYNLPYTNTKEVATFVNEKIEDGSIIIEVDLPAIYSFNTATYVQINKKVDYYNAMLKVINDYDVKLRYDGKDKEIYKNTDTVEDEELISVINELSGKYEHIYFVGYAKNGCGKDNMYNYQVLDSYEKIGELNTSSEYIEWQKPVLSVYKIK